MKIFSLFILVLGLSVAGFGQVKKPIAKPTPPIIEIEATTKDGKAVILSSDGTWKF